jgi:hypothetical protein
MFSTGSGAAKLSLVVVIGLVGLKVVVAVITGSIRSLLMRSTLSDMARWRMLRL